MFLKQHAPILLAIILGTSFFLSVGAMRNDSATFDERAHIPAAYSSVRYGDMRLNPEHPPLLKNLAGIPLLFLQPHFPIESTLWTNGITKEWQFGTTMWSTWGLGTEFLYRIGNDAESILFWSRLPFVFLSLLLGFFIYRFTKELAGTSAGLFAALLYSFDPNVLAHNHLVTTDVGIAAFIFFSVIAFARFLKEPSGKHILWAGFTLGLAELSKFSAAILIPFFGVLVLLAAITRKTHPESNASERRFRLHAIRVFFFGYFKILIIAFALIWVGYALNTWDMPVEKTLAHASLVFAGDAPAKTFARNTVIAIAQTPGLSALAHYVLGVFMVFSRVTGGNSFYFLGAMPEHASKLYFPIVFFLKETLPMGFLVFFTALASFARFLKPSKKQNRSFGNFFQAHIDQVTMLGFIAFYASLSVFGNLNIGFRHLFPILPFIVVLVSSGLFRFLQSRSNPREDEPCPTRVLTKSIASVFVFWIVAIPLFAYPNYLSYYNEVIGAKNGHRIAVDSNYDWGQNLKRLKIWVDEYNRCITEHPRDKRLNICAPESPKNTILPDKSIETIHIDYYGGSEVDYYFPQGTYANWHSGNAPESGWFAVSATFFEENTHKKLKPGETDYSWLLKYQPIARAGNSLFIFYVSPESLASGGNK